MKKHLLFVFAIFLSTISLGQLTGSKYIPGSGGPDDYPTIASAVTALNTSGVGAGGVTFYVTAGYTETAVNLVFTTTTSSASNAIVFVKSGSGTNPLITAAPGTSASFDGIIKFAGTDYVTFNGIDLVDPVTNTSPTTRMEWGYAILMASSTDASQHISLVNCSITLQKAYNVSPYSNGIYSNSITADGISAAPTSPAGVVSYCSVDNCVVSNVIYGVNWLGNSNVTYYGINNYFGYAVGNTINDFGTTDASPYGMYFSAQNNLKIYNNNISGGNGATNPVYGIRTNGGTNSNVEIFYNTLNLTSSGTSTAINGIYSNMGGTGTNNQVTIKYNTISITFPTNTSGSVFGIYHPINAWKCDIMENTITDCVIGSSTTTSTGTFYGIWASGSNTTAGSTWNISQNTINNNKRVQSVRGSGPAYGIYNTTSGLSCSINDNIIMDNIWPSSGNVYGIYVSNSSAATLNIMRNTIHDISKPDALTNVLPRSGSLFGIFVNHTAANGTCLESDNEVYNLSNTWGGQVMAYRSDVGANATLKFFSNKAHAITAIDQAIYGIYNGTGLNVHIYGNRLYDMHAAIGDSAAFYGIYTGSATSGASTYVYNNFVSDLTAPEASVFTSSGLHLFGTVAGTIHRYYNNTVYLNQVATAGSPFTAAVYANTSPTLDMQNNILVNNSTVLSGGITAAFWCSSTSTASYSANSNYNCFHAGTPGGSNLIFYDGTNADQTLAAYQTRFPQEIQSFSEIPPFINNVTAPYNLHLNSEVATFCESGASTITVPEIITDFDNQARYPYTGYPVNVNPIYSPTSPDVGADEFGGKMIFTCITPNPGMTIASSNNFCPGNATTLSLQNSTAGTGVSYQWQSSVDGTEYAIIAGASNATYDVVPIASLYFRCEVTCLNGPTSITSAPLQIFLNPIPGAAGAISGTSTVTQGQTDVVFSVNPIADATGYTWSLPAGATIISGDNTYSITVSFSGTAVSGNLTVTGVNGCGNGTSSPEFNLTVNPPLPENLTVTGVVGPGIVNCYNATNSITVAGNGTTFEVQNGGSATFIAGQMISFLVGTTVLEGGYMHGYITSTGEYCSSLVNPVVNNPLQFGEVKSTVPEFAKTQRIIAYPNPTTGLFTLEMNHTSESTMSKVEVYSISGVKVLSQDLAGERKHQFSLDGMSSGLYFIHVTATSGFETLKMIKM